MNIPEVIKIYVRASRRSFLAPFYTDVQTPRKQSSHSVLSPKPVTLFGRTEILKMQCSSPVPTASLSHKPAISGCT